LLKKNDITKTLSLNIRKTVYNVDKKILQFLTLVSIGKITIETSTASKDNKIKNVEFYLDNTF